MQITELLYLKDYRSLSCQARVVEVRKEDERAIVVLDQTIFYPQGGGQPYDQGFIESPSGRFIVGEVRYDDGTVNHIGVFGSGSFTNGEGVLCTIDQERRELHSRIHSAGHVVDWAVLDLKLPWQPGKGYHFPEGPYVEYENTDDAEKDKEVLKDRIEEECNRIVAEDHETKAAFVEKQEMSVLCHFVPENIPSGKPGRVIRFGDAFGVPCGGTHVQKLSEIGRMVIRKIKQSGKNIRVGYEVA